MLPVDPLKVNRVLFVPEQTVALPAKLPPTDNGLTSIVAMLLFARAHEPLVITAL
jgi:hypothetical protein